MKRAAIVAVWCMSMAGSWSIGSFWADNVWMDRISRSPLHDCRGIK